jgi:hypothetical protein
MSQPTINPASSVKNLHIQVNNLFAGDNHNQDTNRVSEKGNVDKEFLTKKNSLANGSQQMSVTDYVSFLQGHSIQGGQGN